MYVDIYGTSEGLRFIKKNIKDIKLKELPEDFPIHLLLSNLTALEQLTLLSFPKKGK